MHLYADKAHNERAVNEIFPSAPYIVNEKIEYLVAFLLSLLPPPLGIGFFFPNVR